MTTSNKILSVPLKDGYSVEAVYYGSGTLCLSTQVGCAMGCPFCASGSKGLFRNLTSEELHLQVEHAGRQGFLPKRLTLSGIGEPLHNPEAVKRFIVGNGEKGLPVSFTTTGKPLHRLGEFMSLPHNGLMISLHAGTAATHKRLIPQGPDFQKLWQALHEIWPQLSRNQRRRIGINYLLLRGKNDTETELSALSDLLCSFPEITLHLLTLNKVDGSNFTSPAKEEIDRTYLILKKQGINVRRANRWRRQREGGCGTLAVKQWQKKNRSSQFSDRISLRLGS